MPTKSKTFLLPPLRELGGFGRKVFMRKVNLKVILKSIWDFLKKFKKPQKKALTTIHINVGEIHIDKIEVNVFLDN